MTDHRFNSARQSFESGIALFPLAEVSEQASDNLRDEYFSLVDKPKQQVQAQIEQPDQLVAQRQQSPFEQLGDIFHQMIEQQMRAKTAPQGERKMQANGCYSSPAYENLIDVVAKNMYDPKTLGNVDKLKHKFDCQIKDDTDAIKYAQQALKVNGDPYTAIFLNANVFPGAFGMIGVTLKQPKEASPPSPVPHAKPGSPEPATQHNSALVTLESVEKGSPAAKAGLKPGDQIKAVDDVSMVGKSWEDVAGFIRGPADTTVQLTVIRQGAIKKLDVVRAAWKSDESADAPASTGPNLSGGIGVGVGLLNKDGSGVIKDTSTTKIHDHTELTKRQESDVVITHVSAGSPAERAGIKRGDIIKEVDGKDLSGKTLDEMVALVRGSAGRAVDLTILHDGKTSHVGLIREQLKREPVVSDKNLGDGIAYVRLSDFEHEGGAEQFAAAIRKYDKAKAFVIDVRDNPGGDLNQALGISELFIKSGMIVTLDERQESDPTRPKYASNKYSVNATDLIETVEDGSGTPKSHKEQRTPYLINGRPVVLLTNENSASASELFTGALHDNAAAITVGEKTFGKGIGQTVAPSQDGSFEVHITKFRYYTPKGFWPGDAKDHRIGIAPDVNVPDNLNGGDPQLDAAIKLLQKRLWSKTK